MSGVDSISDVTRLLPTPTASDMTGGKPKDRGSMLKSIRHLLPTPEASDGSGGRVTNWGVYEVAVRQWERIRGVPAPLPTMTGLRGGQVLNPELSEWMMGLDPGHVTGVGLSRTKALKVIGNGVVPQQAEAALDDLLDGWI